MCDPVSIGVATFGLSAAQSVVSGIMGNASARANANALEQQAQIRLQKGEYDASQAVNRYERVAGQARANVGVTGISMDSFGDVLADSAMESALEVKAIRWGAAHEADNLRFQAAAQRANAKAATIGSIFGVAGAALKGFGTYKAWDTGTGTGLGATSPFKATVNAVQMPLGVAY